MAQKSILLLNNFHLGGIADSKYSGIPNSLASLVGCDIHSEPGVLKVNQALVKESGAIVDNAVSKIVVCSDGNSYLFDRGAGKIWKRTSGGTYSLEATNGNGATLNAREYAGYVYYCSATKLGRWQIGSAWATRNDNFATFLNGNATYHPMFVKNGVLYIGDGNVVAQVDVGTFSNNALDVEPKYVVRSLGEVESDLLIGTQVATNVNEARVFRWNTIAISFTNDDGAPEQGVNCFLPSDNFIMVQAGQKGNLFTYNGAQLEQFKRIAGDWTSTKQAFVNNDAAANFFGTPLFGLSNSSGNPALQGVYSFGSYSSNYPRVLNLEYILSNAHSSSVEITAMAVAGNDLLVAWVDNTGAPTYGVDKIDWSNKYASAYFETRVFTLDRMNGKDMNVKIAYRSLPTGTNITLEKKINNGAYSSVTLRQDANKALFETPVRVGGAGSVQYKVAFVASGNTAPELEAVEISYF